MFDDDDMQDDTFDMGRAADAISEIPGLSAEVVMSGGNCATIEVWKTGQSRRTELPHVTAGPGVYSSLEASSLEFSIGPDNYRYGDESYDFCLTMPEYVADPIEWLTSRASLLMARTDYMTSLHNLVSEV